MRKIILASAIAFVLAAAPEPIAASTHVIDGEVRKIDQSAGKITIKHGAIKKFDMDDGMTMVFRAQDPAMLKAVKAGDKVKFETDKINGQFTVTRIEKAK